MDLMDERYHGAAGMSVNSTKDRCGGDEVEGAAHRDAAAAAATTPFNTITPATPASSGAAAAGALSPRIPLSDLAVLPTLFPAPIANLVTALATSARLSLHVAAFFIEAILETSQYSTRLGLGYTRRVLISAISSARRIYLMSNAAMDGDLVGLMGFGFDEHRKPSSASALLPSTSFAPTSSTLAPPPTSASTDHFLQVLDRYTNLGIYVIHHTFTMAELFTMSGFYLTANAVQSAHFAAQESVALFDSIFGSNESSRALSSIITMVRRELLEDERFKAKDKGRLTSLTALTKALTAFACLQTATWKRTADRLQMKVLYDCTVTSELDESFQSATAVYNNLLSEHQHQQQLVQPNEPHPAPLDGPSILAARDLRWRSFGPQQAGQAGQVGGQDNHLLPHRPPHESSLGLDDLSALEKLLGGSDAEPDGRTRQAVKADDTGQGFEEDNTGQEVGEGRDRSIRYGRSKRRTRDMFEITDTLTELTFTTHLLEPEQVGSGQNPGRSASHSRRPSLGLPELKVEEADADKEDEQMPLAEQVGSTGEAAVMDSDENEWIEVDQLLDHEMRDDKGPVIPSVPNGGTPGGSASYHDALECSSASPKRRLVLRTMTNKLLQHKRTFRRVRGPSEDVSEGSGSGSGRENTTGGAGAVGAVGVPGKRSASRLGSRPDVRRVDWSKKSKSPPVVSIQSVARSESPGCGNGSGTPVKTTRVSLYQTDTTPSSFPTTRKAEPLQTPLRNSEPLHTSTRTPEPLQPPQRKSEPLHAPSGKSELMPTPSSRKPDSPLSPRKAESQVGKAISRARAALSMGSRQTSRETSPHRQEVPTERRSETPKSGSGRFEKRYPDTGVRAPPPSPMVSVPVSRKSSDTYRSRETQRNRPSLTAVHETVHSSQTRVQAASSQRPEQADETPGSLFPHDSLIRNIHRFMRYSSAAYGQNFLRIFGLGNSDYNFSSTARHHANSWAFAQHTNIPIDSLLLSSFMEHTSFPRSKAPPLVHYIAVEHKLQAVVLTCRGTLGLSDLLVDLTCEYRSIQVEGGDPDGDYYVHSGMYQSALGLTVKQSTVHQTLVDTLNKYPTYGLVVTGHSLGGGVAALLAIACSTPSAMFVRENQARAHSVTHPPITTPFVTSFNSGLPAGRPIHAYAYGPPAIASPDLAKHARGLITSVVQNSDVVPCISLGTLRDLRNIALTLYEEGNVAEEIVGRVVGIYHSKLPFQNSLVSLPGSSQFSTPPSALQSPSASVPGDDEVLRDWMVSLIKTMRADMDSDKLYPPGVVYILEYFDVFVTTEANEAEKRRGAKATHHKQAHRVILRQCDSVEERFREPLFTKTMLNDHLPSHYERSTQLLYDGMGCGKM